MQVHGGLAIKNDIAATDADDLRDACPRVVHETEQDSVALPSPCLIVRSVEDSPDLLSCQKPDQRTIGSLHRNGECLLYDPQSAEVMMTCVFEECSQPGKPRIPAPNAVATNLLQMIEEIEQQLRVQVGERDCTWSLTD